MITEHHTQALKVIIQAAETEPAIVWALTGSTSFALQGMNLIAHDIDVMTNGEDAYELARRLARYVVKPVAYSQAHNIKSHFGRLNICGVDVEIMGDIQKKLPDGTWEPVFEIAPVTKLIQQEGMTIPVITLTHEARAYRILGRTERADAIERHLQPHATD